MMILNAFPGGVRMQNLLTCEKCISVCQAGEKLKLCVSWQPCLKRIFVLEHTLGMLGKLGPNSPYALPQKARFQKEVRW